MHVQLADSGGLQPAQMITYTKYYEYGPFHAPHGPSHNPSAPSSFLLGYTMA